jgi:hypothetical protein
LELLAAVSYSELIGKVMNRIPRTMYMVYGIGGYFYVSLLTNFFVPTLIVTLTVIGVVTGIYNLMNDKGRVPNA